MHLAARLHLLRGRISFPLSHLCSSPCVFFALLNANKNSTHPSDSNFITGASLARILTLSSSTVSQNPPGLVIEQSNTSHSVCGCTQAAPSAAHCPPALIHKDFLLYRWNGKFHLLLEKIHE